MPELDANQQQVERIGEGAPDGQLPARDLVLDEQQGHVHAEIGGADAEPQLDDGGLIELDHEEHVEQGRGQHYGRHHKSEEEEGDVRSLPTVSRLHQQRARLLLADPFVQIEPIDDRLHVLLGGTPQRDPLAAGKALTLPLPNLFPLYRDRLHPLAKRVGRNQRHRQGEHGRNGANGRKHHGEKASVEDVRYQKIEHGICFRNRN